MSAFKIFEVANELNTTSDKLMAICKKLGIKVKSNGSSIDEEQKNMVVAEFKSMSIKAEKKAPAKKSAVIVQAKPVKKTAVKKSSSSKIKWIKISDSPGGEDEVKEETDEQEEAIAGQAEISEVKETVKTAETKKAPAKKSAGTAKAIKSKAAGKKPEELTAGKIKKQDSAAPGKEVLPGKTAKVADAAVKTKTAIKEEDKAAAEKAATPEKTGMASGKKLPEHKEDAKAPKSPKAKKRPGQHEVYTGADIQESAEEEDFVDIEEEKFIKKTLLKEKGTDTFKVRQPWNEEKKINIKKVLDRELDKEEKEGRFRPRPRLAAKKYAAPERVSEKTAEKDTSKQQEKSTEKVIKRPEIKKIIENKTAFRKNRNFL